MAVLSCFKAYDIRGKLGVELNEDIAYRIGRAYGELLKPRSMVVGGDVRLTSEGLKQALARGLNDAGADVLDIGMSGTEEIYFSTSHLGVDGGIEVTASHNPMDYNGMKLVREQSRPISGDTGLRDIQRLAEENAFGPVARVRGTLRRVDVLSAYVDHLLGFIDLARFRRPMTLVINSGNGAAGHVVDAIEARFQAAGAPVTFVKVHHQPDGNFPNGIPNPLLPECRQDTTLAVQTAGADIGIAFDGDFDRCFLFDEEGGFVEGYYIVGLLAEAFLQKHPDSKIIHDPRLTWNTEDIVSRSGGTPVMSKTGHAFIKERMRAENAIYGGEMSAHHYFRDFFYCDSGMIPWLLVAELMAVRGQSLSQLVGERMRAYPASGEINRTLRDAGAALARIKAHYAAAAVEIDTTDGLSLSFADWRFNVRSSNTEPVVRLNVESRGNAGLMEEKTREILALMDSN
ncbi:Phosphomannomutase/phosphoglucomutase [Sodalis glossinidius str. 'morsitans']|uniref:Phosphomannomutase n=1 Tax=Sodalis glossinidius (strain morsitans) TaxID=343509 RepID=Q2NTY5_SODGM|nr:phosphomannomutase CpsG [Sodalis glossinidius]BAE74390.1 phosphomannomutase [Sodalis glossinidius str. 'morsitans']CRL45012.1 Phosphomannomutase/phosphoglucomutase [Sodalis glossinidius str. 'morsitans']